MWGLVPSRARPLTSLTCPDPAGTGHGGPLVSRGCLGVVVEEEKAGNARRHHAQRNENGGAHELEVCLIEACLGRDLR
jgi:hypothetical protein